MSPEEPPPVNHHRAGAAPLPGLEVQGGSGDPPAWRHPPPSTRARRGGEGLRHRPPPGGGLVLVPASLWDGRINACPSVRVWAASVPLWSLPQLVQLTEPAGNWSETGMGQTRWGNEGGTGRLKPTGIGMGGLEGSNPLGYGWRALGGSNPL